MEQEAATRALSGNLDLGSNEAVLVGHWVGGAIDAARSVIEMHEPLNLSRKSGAISFKHVTATAALVGNGSTGAHVAKWNRGLNRPRYWTCWKIQVMH